MTLQDYFGIRTGTSILSSADGEGILTTAIYSAPRVLGKNTVAFIMRERRTYRNLQHNPYAAYMFIEDGGKYHGIRLFLTKIREDDNPELIAKMTRRNLTPEEDRELGPKHLMIFKVDRVLPLVGVGDTGIELGEDE